MSHNRTTDTPPTSQNREPEDAAGQDRQEPSPNSTELLARFDLRVRSIDRVAGEPINLCCHPDCDRQATWSLWLHTPEWGATGGGTYVRCHRHAISMLQRQYDLAAAWIEPPTRQSSLRGGVL